MLGILYGVKCRSAYQATTSSVHALASMQRRFGSISVQINCQLPPPSQFEAPESLCRRCLPRLSFAIFLVCLMAVDDLPLRPDRLHAAQQGAAGGVVLLGLADALPPARWLSSLRPAVFPALEAFVGRLLELLDLLARRFPGVAQHIHDSGAVRELFVSNLRSPQQTARSATVQLLVRCVTEGGVAAAEELAELVEKRVLYAVQQHHGMDVAAASLLELGLVARLVEHHQVCQQTLQTHSPDKGIIWPSNPI